MREHHVQTVRSARFYTLGEMDDRVTDVWLVCHGYGQLAGEFMRSFERITDPLRLIVAPEALSRFYLDNTMPADGTPRRVGASWMTREDREAEIEDQVRYLDAMYAVIYAAVSRERSRLRILGFSQGVATVARWIVRRDVRPDDLILWAGSLPPEIDPGAHRDRFAASRITLVQGTRDEYAPLARLEADADRFRAHGLSPRTLTFDGGHRLDWDLLGSLALQTADEHSTSQ